MLLVLIQLPERMGCSRQIKMKRESRVDTHAGRVVKNFLPGEEGFCKGNLYPCE